MEPTKFDMKYASIRQAIIEQRFEKLNARQREAVFQTDGPLLILAGAGSGKTTVLINRIINLLRFGQGLTDPFAPEWATDDDLLFLAEYLNDPKPENRARAEHLCAVRPAKPWEVIAITFTNKAARELRERLELALGDEEAASAVWAYTFHTACLRILRRHVDLLGFESAFTIYDEDDKKRVITNVMKKLNLDPKTFDPRTVMGMISRAKDKLMTPKQFAADAAGDYFREKVSDIYRQYEKEMKKACALDFDDIIMKTVLLLQNNPEVLEFYQHKFRYVLVDEYQDTNYAQYVLTSLLAGYYENICVVGDDDQSIYKFRGATITNILEFEKQFKDAKTIRLEQNYRSTGNILAAANAVIANNRERKGKTLWTAQSGGDPVTLFEARNEDDEADFVARTIASARRPMRDFAVLYRTNAQSRSIELALKRRSIPYRIFGGTRFFDRAEVKDILAYLSVIANPTDETRLLRIVNEPPRGIGATSLEKIREIAAAENISVFEAMTTASHRTGIAAGKRMEEFCRMIAELQEAVSALPLDEFYDAVVERTGYALALETKGGDENVTRLENIAELKSSIVKSVEANPDLDLYSYLDEVALYTDLDNYDRAEDAAVMMTMHAAKGLEFPVVFIIGAEEGLFPSMQAIGQSEDMEEERRLCYVAITRAREKLYITCAAQRMLYGRTSANLPSRFTEEIPQTLLDRQGLAKKKANLWDDDGTFISGRSGTWGGGASGYSGGGVSYRPGSFGTSYAARTGRTGAAKRAAPEKPKTVLSAPKAPDFKKGDRVVHKAFGKGVIEKMTPMGGDALVEVKFDSGETKRMMLRVAAQHMTKGE